LRLELPRRGRPRQSSEPGEAVRLGARSAGGAQREAFCLALLHASPGLRKLGLDLNENLFTLSEHRELFLRWREGKPVTEDEEVLWEHLQSILATRIPYTETAQAEKAFLDCVDRLERVTIRAVKEASALALAEAEAGVRPGQVASVARARMGAGIAEENIEDANTIAVASQLLEDMEAGLRFHRRLIEGPSSDQKGSHSAD
jgi:hypothetical protein